jgi:RNA polymerase sigma-70 factor (ECF subfamily)
MVITKTTTKEDELVSLLKSGDQKAIRTIYDNYSPALYGIMLRIVDSEETAEDLLQEAMVKIWKNASRYDKNKGKLFTWLVNIARNTAIDYLRSKEHKMKGQIQGIDNSVSFINRRFSITPNVEHIGLKNIIDNLRPDYRILIDKIYFEGYTQEEAAKELSIPLGTIKTRIRAAISRLREVMK